MSLEASISVVSKPSVIVSLFTLFAVSVDYQEKSFERSYTQPEQFCLPVVIIDDDDAELTEAFAIRFVIESRPGGVPVGAEVLASCTVEVFLADDDIPPGENKRSS